MEKRILSMLLAIMMVIPLLPTAVFATENGTLPGARVETNDYGDVFLGGNYIEVGISKHGSFGTSRLPTTSGWHYQTGMDYPGVGLLSDEDGWNIGETSKTGDFFLPGSPEERWILSYIIGDTPYEYPIADRRNRGDAGPWKEEPTTKNASDLQNGLLKAVVTGVTRQNVKIEITYSFDVNWLFYTTDVTITNLGESTIEDVRFVRSFDPDQDQKNTDLYDTYNKVICNPDSDEPGSATNYAMVVARGAETLSGFFFLSFDNRARASQGVAFSPWSAYLSGLWDAAPETAKTYATEADLEMSIENKNGYEYDDTAIALTFKIGSLTPNTSTDLEYYSSLDPDVQNSLKNVLSIQVDYKAEVLTGFVAGKTYHITCNGKTYIFNNISGTTIPLNGSAPTTVSNGDTVAYDFIGQTITIVEKNASGENVAADQEIVVSPRPGQSSSAESTPLYPAPVLPDITADFTSLTISAVETQEYCLNPNPNQIPWTKPIGTTVIFSDLTPGTEYTVYTRVAATNDHPASATISKSVYTKANIIYTGDVSTEMGTMDNVAAEGLDAAATALQKNIILTVKDAETTLGDLEQNEIKKNAGNQTLEFLDITLTDNLGANVQVPSNMVLEIVVPFVVGNKQNVTVYRYHENSATAFAPLNAKPATDAWTDATFYVDSANNKIHIYTNKFSTYAIGYTGEPQNNPMDNQWLSVLMTLYKKQFDITATAFDGGNISPAGVTAVKYKKNITYTITPDDGYMIADVFVDGVSVGAVGEYTFQRVRKGHNIVAIFVKIP